MNLKTGKIESFAHYSKFSSLKEFNNHFEQWLLEHKHDFTKSELIGLKHLVRFCAKVPGVSNAKIGTILKAINEDLGENGISRSTFKRMTQKAVKIGILSIHETERKNGSQTSNLYVFNRFTTIEPPKPEILNHPETSNLSKQKNQEIKERPAEQKQLDESFTNDKIPQEFTELVNCFFPNSKTIEEYWRMANIAAYSNYRDNEPDTVLDIAIHAFKQMIGKLKSRTAIRNPIAYYYGILSKKFIGLHFLEMEEELVMYAHADN
ncbi:hypothetical protein [Bacillus sp. FJAT-27245]|uniref:hypothetical protein n=1 Tax=Bacillus sp. FJAT-27245 TaxID=1684144 RepID=UPI0006A7C29D|nr:hypothetical protein [Bacillus sp. FJAT-27245]